MSETADVNADPYAREPALKDVPTANLRTAIASRDPLRLLNAVALELRCIARFHQRVTKAEVRVRSAFLDDLAGYIAFAALDVVSRPQDPTTGAPEGTDATVAAILRGVVEALGESWSDWHEEPWQDIVAAVDDLRVQAAALATARAAAPPTAHPEVKP